MKKSNIVLSILLVLLMLAGWGVQFLNMVKIDSQYSTVLRQAERYNEAGLYQKAVQSCETALMIKEQKSIRELWIESFSNAYEDKAVSLDAYIGALESMCDLYEREVVYWERLITLQMENGKVDDAYDTYMDFKEAGFSSQVIDGYSNDILYIFRTHRKPYQEYVRNATGYYTVKDSQGWGIIRPNGEKVYGCIYEYISPYNANYEALFISEKGQRIADAKAVVQAKIDIVYTKTGAWVDGLLPVCGEDGSWYYLDCQSNEIAHGSYEYASNYASGIAAVFDGEAWSLIDHAGNAVSQKRFSDVKIHSNGDYQYEGIMIAAENGQYGMYNANGELLHDFRAADMDIYMGGAVAYCDVSTGKWGMVTTKGEICIQPTYTEAKSFSNGLAAVRDGEMWGFANSVGDVVIEQQFAEADYFTSGGLCAVSETGQSYFFIQLKFFGI